MQARRATPRMAYYASGDFSTMSFVLKLRYRLPALLLVFAANLFFTGYSVAQSAADAAKIAAGLAPESRAVIERLSGLRELPDGVWKIHAGDLAHGEAVEPTFPEVVMQGA